MPKRKPYRGGRGGGGGRGRGRGNSQPHRGAKRGAGRGRNRELIPTPFGFVYNTQTGYTSSDLEDDFRLFGQFGDIDVTDSDDDSVDEVFFTRQHTKHPDRSSPIQSNHSRHGNERGRGQGRGRGRGRGQDVGPRRDVSKYLQAVNFSPSKTILNPSSSGQGGEKPTDEETKVEPQVSDDSDDESIDEETLFRILYGSDDDYDEYFDDEDEYYEDEDDLEILQDYIEHMTLNDDDNQIISDMQLEELFLRMEIEDYLLGAGLNDLGEVSPRGATDNTEDESSEEEEEEEEEEGEDEDEDEDEEDESPMHRQPKVSLDSMRLSLTAAMDQVPPSLQRGIKSWIQEQDARSELKQRGEKKQAKKKKNKQKSMEKKAKIREKQKAKEAEMWEPGSVRQQLERLDKRIRDFIIDDQLNSYQLAPMPKHMRRLVHLLATSYQLKSKSIGTGPQRAPVFTKTRRTCIPASRHRIDRFIATAHIEDTPQPLRKFRVDSDTPSKSREPKTTRPVHGSVVAHNAQPIGESNVGHRMLAAMGWQQGQALGAKKDGITAPIEAVVRTHRGGLGS